MKEYPTMISLKRSARADKKWLVVVDNTNVYQKPAVVHFGQKGAEDFTIHQDEERKRRYIARHRKNETWTKAGLRTAGFWSRWLLWNKPTIAESKRDIEMRFGVKFANK